MQIEERIPLLEDILSRWDEDMGKDYLAYKNHVYRVVHFTMALHKSSEEERKNALRLPIGYNIEYPSTSGVS